MMDESPLKDNNIPFIILDYFINWETTKMFLISMHNMYLPFGVHHVTKKKPSATTDNCQCHLIH